MKSLLRVASLVLASTVCGAQMASLKPDYCSAFSPRSRNACESFEELVDHNDRQIAALMPIKGVGLTYVCFDQTEDRFLLLSLRLPQSGIGSLSQDEYRNGMRASNHHSVNLEWHSPLGREDHTYPDGWWMPPEAQATGAYTDDARISIGKTVATVDPSEISLEYSYRNSKRTVTHYTFYVRRSTARFEETFDAGTPVVSEGHCAVFGETKDNWPKGIKESNQK